MRRMTMKKERGTRAMNRSMTEVRRELARKHLREIAELEKKHRQERIESELGEKPELASVLTIVSSTLAQAEVCQTIGEREATLAGGFRHIVEALKTYVRVV